MLQFMGLQRVKHDRETEQQYGNFTFNFLRNHQSVLQSSCTILYFRKQYTRVSISSHPCQHLLCSTLFIIAILLGKKQYLVSLMICMSLMPNDVLSVSSYIIDHLHISFGQMYIQIYCPFLKLGCLPLCY